MTLFGYNLTVYITMTLSERSFFDNTIRSSLFLISLFRKYFTGTIINIGRSPPTMFTKYFWTLARSGFRKSQLIDYCKRDPEYACKIIPNGINLGTSMFKHK